jgi:hypothetical protein
MDRHPTCHFLPPASINVNFLKITRVQLDTIQPLTTESLEASARQSPTSQLNVRPFRPSIIPFLGKGKKNKN